jgi:hypothetical protein
MNHRLDVMKSMISRAILISGLCIFCILVSGCCSTTETTTTTISERTISYTSVTTQPTIVIASMNQALVVKTYSGTFEVAALEFKRGLEANQLIQAENMFNTKPDSGYEYLLIKVRQKYTKGDSSASVSSYNYKIYANNVGYSREYVVMPKSLKEFESVSLLPGGQTEGWLAFIVPQNTPVKLAYETFGEPSGFIEIK